jgi:hypothetical protein
MAQARARSDAEISLFPFLSILVCLIGSLVLLIVILTIVQSRMGDGRTPQEIDRATEALKLKKEITQREKELEQIKKDSPAAANKDALQQKLTAIVTLRKELALGEDARKKNQEASAELQKKLENLLIQIEGMTREKPPIVRDIEKLKAELLARGKKPEDRPPPIIVQAGGSGTSANTRLYFVECSAAGIVMHKSLTEQVRISSASIGVDAAYDAFLEEARKQPNSMILFLLRDDGLPTYNRAAGWAEGQFKLRIGKLPLPGKGPADLAAFFPK